jgi:hypothetical protein
MDLYAEVESIRNETYDLIWRIRRQDFIDAYGERTYMALYEVICQDAKVGR